MRQKPNYAFERRERQKARALKKAERERLKKEKSDQRKEDPLRDNPAEPSGESLEQRVGLSGTS